MSDTSEKVLAFSNAKETKTREQRKEMADAIRGMADTMEQEGCSQGFILIIDRGAEGHSWNLGGITSVSRMIGLLEQQKYRLIVGAEEDTN